MKTIKGYWFSESDALPNGDFRPIVVGESHHVDGTIVPCRWGLHASRNPLHALRYAHGNILWGVELFGKIIPHLDDKYVASNRRYLWRIDADDMLRRFARKCALDVSHLWNAPDVVNKYLRTGDSKLREVAWNAFTNASRYRDRSSISWITARCSADGVFLHDSWTSAKTSSVNSSWAIAWAIDDSFNWNESSDKAKKKLRHRFTSMIAAERKKINE